uniref:hypothetical protein n=1 Tax=Hafnia alvei TaxID=569 RepID=UPI0026EAA026|nr:hypothetical protein [Hafnia alvei]
MLHDESPLCCAAQHAMSDRDSQVLKGKSGKVIDEKFKPVAGFHAILRTAPQYGVGECLSL